MLREHTPPLLCSLASVQQWCRSSHLSIPWWKTQQFCTQKMTTVYIQHINTVTIHACTSTHLLGTQCISPCYQINIQMMHYCTAKIPTCIEKYKSSLCHILEQTFMWKKSKVQQNLRMGGTRLKFKSWKIKIHTEKCISKLFLQPSERYVNPEICL